MNKCLQCEKNVSNKYCDVTCQNKHQGSSRANKKYGLIKEFKVNCSRCGIETSTEEREKLFPKKKNYFCSRACSNKRNHSDETKKKISQSLKINQSLKIRIGECKGCNKEFQKKRKVQIFCSKSCASTWNNINLGISRKGGLASSKSQPKRSKNEVHFSKLCKSYFNDVLTNKQIFNGWDADIIIKDIKFAVLWNGVWHYKKITKKHSVKQVQNRDKIKIKEIINSQYTPYIIKDMGKENLTFVKKEFDKFIDYLKQNNYICV